MKSTAHGREPRVTGSYRAFPKVELHRHLEGSLRLETLLELGRGLSLADTHRLEDLVQVGEGESFTFENFLSKFQTLRLFYRSPEIIERIAREAVADAASDGVRYLELRFTPAALSRAEGFHLGEVMDWVITGVQNASAEVDIETRLIASLNRHESPQLAESVAYLAVERMDRGIVGLDLAGNEAHFSCLPFAGAFREAKESGLHITVHAGEWGGAQNVVDGILHLGAERIGHGIRVLEDPAAVALARARGVVFEVCVTSNYQSGVVPKLNLHPLPQMVDQGLNVTINTDDPSISKITLSDEYRLVVEDLGLSLEELRARVLAAAQAAFLPAAERQELVSELKEEFARLD